MSAPGDAAGSAEADMIEEGLVARMRRSLATGRRGSDVEQIAMRLERRLERIRDRRPDYAAIQLSDHVRQRLPRAIPA